MFQTFCGNILKILKISKNANDLGKALIKSWKSCYDKKANIIKKFLILFVNEKAQTQQMEKNSEDENLGADER